MSRHYHGCPDEKYGMACDLDSDRTNMCSVCLQYLIRLERPEGWSPLVKREDPPQKKEDKP